MKFDSLAGFQTIQFIDCVCHWKTIDVFDFFQNLISSKNTTFCQYITLFTKSDWARVPRKLWPQTQKAVPPGVSKIQTRKIKQFLTACLPRIASRLLIHCSSMPVADLGELAPLPVIWGKKRTNQRRKKSPQGKQNNPLPLGWGSGSATGYDLQWETEGKNTTLCGRSWK